MDVVEDFPYVIGVRGNGKVEVAFLSHAFLIHNWPRGFAGDLLELKKIH